MGAPKKNTNATKPAAVKRMYRKIFAVNLTESELKAFFKAFAASGCKSYSAFMKLRIFG